MSLRCVLLEDEPSMGQVIVSHLHKIPEIQTLQVVQDLDSLEARLRLGAVDVLILVVSDLDPKHWFFWEVLPLRPVLWVYSGRDVEAQARAMGANACWSLPCNGEVLQQAVQALERSAAEPPLPTATPSPPTFARRFFFVKSDYKIVKINFEDILYIEGLGEYVRIYTTEEKIVSLLSLNRLEETLPQDMFARIHRSYIINIDKINFIQNNIVSIGKHQLPISKSQKKPFLDFIDANGLL